MSESVLSSKAQEYVAELMRRKTISEESLSDQMLLNYLCSLKIDEDYFCTGHPEDLKRMSA